MQDHNHDNSNLPARRRAATELPDQEAVGAAGIDLPREEALAVFAAVSRVAGKGRSKARMHVHDMLMGLAFMAREQLERNGQVEPAPFPELPLERWPQGPEVFRKLGITNRDLEGYWAQARHRADDASLPLEWALALVPGTGVADDLQADRVGARACPHADGVGGRHDGTDDHAAPPAASRGRLAALAVDHRAAGGRRVATA